MGSQRVGHDWATELNWTFIGYNFLSLFLLKSILSFFFIRKCRCITVSSQKETEKGEEAGKSRWLKRNVEGAFPGFKRFFICLPSWFSFFLSFFLFFSWGMVKSFYKRKFEKVTLPFLLLFLPCAIVPWVQCTSHT